MAFSILKDGNRVSTWWGISATDGITPVAIKINSGGGGVIVDDTGTTSVVITNGVPKNAFKDNNFTNCLMGQSSADATVYIPVSVNPATGAVLIKST